jgi:hypothetical protein
VIFPGLQISPVASKRPRLFSDEIESPMLFKQDLSEQQDILETDQMPNFEVDDCESKTNKSEIEINMTTAATEGDKGPWDEVFFARLAEQLRHVISTFLAT